MGTCDLHEKSLFLFPLFIGNGTLGDWGTCCSSRGHADDISIDFFLFLKESKIQVLEKTYCSLLLFPRVLAELLPKSFPAMSSQVLNRPINEVPFRAFGEHFCNLIYLLFKIFSAKQAHCKRKPSHPSC